MGNRFNDKLFSSEINSFKERFLDALEKSELLIVGLQKKESCVSGANELYAIFRSLRSFAEILQAELFLKTFKVLEELFGVLRKRDRPVEKDIVDWLLMINDSMMSWGEKLKEDETDFEPLDSYTLNMLKVSVLNSGRNREILKGLTLLYVYDNHKSAAPVIDFFKANFKEVHLAKSIAEAKKVAKPDFVVISAGAKEDDAIAYIKSINKDIQIPIVIAYEKPEFAQINHKFDEIFVDGYIEKPIDIERLRGTVMQIAELHYAQKLVRIMDTKLLEIVRSIKPFPKTILQIKELNESPDFSLRDLSTIISKDPLLSAKLLKTVNSPLFGLKSDITNANQAVTMLGRDKSVALCLQAGVGDALKIDVSPYSMSVDDFYAVSQKRMELMNAWYSKVSFSALPILTTTALLGNIGQIITSEVMRKKNLSEKYAQLFASAGRKNAEMQLFGAISEDITADMMMFWKFDPMLVESVRFAFDIANANDSIRSMAIANFVVYMTVPLTSSKIDDAVVSEMADFLKEMNLNPKSYLAAVEKIEANY